MAKIQCLIDIDHPCLHYPYGMKLLILRMFYYFKAYHPPKESTLLHNWITLHHFCWKICTYLILRNTHFLKFLKFVHSYNLDHLTLLKFINLYNNLKKFKNIKCKKRGTCTPKTPKFGKFSFYICRGNTFSDWTSKLNKFLTVQDLVVKYARKSYQFAY